MLRVEGLGRRVVAKELKARWGSRGVRVDDLGVKGSGV